jgi:hypothetical protein
MTLITGLHTADTRIDNEKKMNPSQGSNEWTIGPRRLKVWPSNQQLESADESIRATTFRDTGDYHPALIARLLELEKQKWGDDKPDSRILGGRKVHHLDQWNIPEADFINARAKELFGHTLGSPTAHIDLSWANVYWKWDYVGPHAHRVSIASLVYFLDLGDEDHEDRQSGRLFFADPRLSICCSEEPGRMTTPFFPTVEPGTMMIWPSEVVHCVTPYTGERPRMTLAWNISRRKGELGQSDEFTGVAKTPTDRA